MGSALFTLFNFVLEHLCSVRLLMWLGSPIMSLCQCVEMDTETEKKVLHIRIFAYSYGRKYLCPL